MVTITTDSISIAAIAQEGNTSGVVSVRRFQTDNDQIASEHLLRDLEELRDVLTKMTEAVALRLTRVAEDIKERDLLDGLGGIAG